MENASFQMATLADNPFKRVRFKFLHCPDPCGTPFSDCDPLVDGELRHLP